MVLHAQKKSVAIRDAKSAKRVAQTRRRWKSYNPLSVSTSVPLLPQFLHPSRAAVGVAHGSELLIFHGNCTSVAEKLLQVNKT